MEFRILGPVEAWGPEGRARLAGARQLALLSALLLHANQVVPVEQLVDAVWAEDPPPNAGAALQTLVFRLRRTLNTVEPSAGQRLTFTSGYRLRVEPDELDLAAFRGHVQQGRAATRLDAAAKEFQSALRLWRGTALDGAQGGYFAATVTRLTEERLTALEERVAVDLALGRHAELVPELRDLVDLHRTRERLHGHLMLALYRAGRAAEALQAFREIGATLADELGIDPGPDLQELHQRILCGDAELATVPAERQDGRNDLPGDIADFTGREAELARLVAALPDRAAAGAVVIEAIDGMAGVGKTTLAVHAAYQLADRYPDAQLFIDLHGHTTDQEATEPRAALDTLLRALGVPAEKIPRTLDERAALWRAELASRRALVVLDNAASAAQVRPLLPGAAGCLALVTSRRRLADLETARTLSLDVLSATEALDLFTRIAGRDRVAEEPEASDDVVELCGHLPLAIRIAAARLRTRPAWTVAHLAERLREGQRRLTELSTGDRSVAAAFTLSYQHLSLDQQRMFRLLGLHPGPNFGTGAAAALANADRADAERLLEDLVDVHLLQQPALDRYRFHDLLAHHAERTVQDTEPEAERRAATTRLLDYYLHTSHAAALLLDPARPPLELAALANGVTPEPLTEQQDGRDWFQIERPVLLGAVRLAVDAGLDVHGWQLPWTMVTFLWRQGHWHDWETTQLTALAAAGRLGDLLGQAQAQRSLGTLGAVLGDTDEATSRLRQALELYAELGDQIGQAQTHRMLGQAFGGQNRYEEARHHTELATGLYREAGNRAGQASALGDTSWCNANLGNYREAIEQATEALALHRELGNRHGEAATLSNLGYSKGKLGDVGAALSDYSAAVQLHREAGDRYNEALIVDDIGDMQFAAGDLNGARDAWEQALAIMDEINHRDAESVRVKLRDLGVGR
ncbi:tetratricopeptide repeat protein [Solihabitans fulvus]|uniref:Tetratricopeptide repeat protein n=1 Tax=Solihabitans fulvus TaxID=1892852 RepID=A0A5B2WPE5_9PSEU|nr:BTAD domain-containing putative transcriptional regulator [Solihabitans fulvus]KAA2252874.1 tetratricopeptide repeat protein [Solihabitans fulvus]